jgi:hypothetical protein
LDIWKKFQILDRVQVLIKLQHKSLVSLRSVDMDIVLYMHEIEI